MRSVARIVVVVCLVSAVALAQRVRVRWERATDFTKYETYTWDDEPVDDIDDEIDQLIVSHIDGVMSINGIFRDDYEPDLFITYYGSAEDSFAIESDYRSDWASPGAITIDSHREGTLVVDIVDVDGNQVIWRGIAGATIDREPRKNRDLVTNALTKMFDSFPPPPPRPR
jgi:hypothetical protein